MNGLTQDEIINFVRNARRAGKEETARKINVGNAYIEALNSPQGKLLLRRFEEILESKLMEIINFKHDDNLPVSQNYDNLLVRISSFRSVQSTGNDWTDKIKGLQDGIKKVKEANEEL